MPLTRRLLVLLAVSATALGCQGPVRPRAAGPVPKTWTTTAMPGSSTTRPVSTTGSTSRPATSTTTRPPPVPPTATIPAGPTTFASTVAPVTAADLPSSWRPGCPLGPDQLRLLHLGYWGFDDQPHTGVMVVNAAVTDDVINIFSTLFRERFPIRQMQLVDAFGGRDPASMDADNTSGFNCRNAVAPGPPHWSVHAFGQAIDVNTVENPYVEGGTVTPAAGRAFLDRSVARPGMAVAGGPLVRAFAAVGWFWGGQWSTPDYQHFSKTGG